jgi:rhamnosyltransferase
MVIPRIAAYITSYEDQESLEKCVSCILRQTHAVDSILIVDNSKDKIILANVSEKVQVRHYPENIGISGGLSIGIQWAMNQKYDFLWTFDQDSQPTEDCLSILLAEYHNLIGKGEIVGIIAPSSFDSSTGIELPGGFFDKYRFVTSNVSKAETYKCDVAITSGSLVYVEAAKRSDKPNIDLFIDAVDWDYCIKLKKEGYSTFMTRKAAMKHRFSNLKLISIPLSRRKIATNNYSPIRRYYICRNHTYVTIRSAKSFFIPIAIAQRIVYTIKSSLVIVLFEKNKFEKVYLGVLGTIDGLRRKLGKRRYESI